IARSKPWSLGRPHPACGLGKMRTEATTPFVVGQIRRVSPPALHRAKRRPPSHPPSTFQTVSERGFSETRIQPVASLRTGAGAIDKLPLMGVLGDLPLLD